MVALRTNPPNWSSQKMWLPGAVSEQEGEQTRYWVKGALLSNSSNRGNQYLDLYVIVETCQDTGVKG